MSICINVRKIEMERDFPTMLKWWGSRGAEFKAEWLPQDTTFVAEHEGRLVFAESLILTNTCYAMLEHLVSDPEAPWQVREQAILRTHDAMAELAEDLGVKNIVVYTNGARVVDKLEQRGFRLAFNKISMMVREI